VAGFDNGYTLHRPHIGTGFGPRRRVYDLMIWSPIYKSKGFDKAKLAFDFFFVTHDFILSPFGFSALRTGFSFFSP